MTSTTPDHSGRILVLLGIRPDVIRCALILRLLKERLGDRCVFAWSGQHYSDNMKDIFFRQLEIAPPDLELGASGSTDGEIVASVIERLSAALVDIRPAATIFLGDTNTVMGSIACASLNVPIVHIEGCMRSYDWRMPEEKYRTVIDHLADVIYAYFPEYKRQGELEGLDSERIVVTGNPIVDILETYFLSGRIRLSDADRIALFADYGIGPDDSFLVMTSHRRENVENPDSLQRIISLAGESGMPVAFPASYRTQRTLQEFAIDIPANVRISDPIGYSELLELMVHSKGALTDSGTVVEEAAVLGVPCVQMRTATERPQVYDCGASVKFDPHVDAGADARAEILAGLARRASGDWTHALGDGHASERIVDDLCARLENDTFRGHAPDAMRRPIHRSYGTGTSDLGRS